MGAGDDSGQGDEGRACVLNYGPHEPPPLVRLGATVVTLTPG